MTEPHFFKPSGAMRIKNDAFLGTPLPPEEPQAANPPNGAILDYYLPATATEVALDILDNHGSTVRHYSSRERDVPPSATAPIAPRWFKQMPKLATEAGGHRFVWDLRYGRSGVPDSGDDEEEDQHWVGPLVIPGKYQAKLRVDGRTVVAPIQVEMDPRASASASVLGLQFSWALKAFTDMVSARKAQAEMQGLSAALDNLKDGPEIAELRTKAAEVLNGGSDREKGMASVSRSLTTALNAIENADRMPPSQVIALYQAASRNLRPGLEKWQQIKSNDLKKVNELLRSRGAKEIQISHLEQEAEAALAH